MSHLDARELPADSARKIVSPFDGGLFTDQPFILPGKPLPAVRRIAAALQEQRERSLPIMERIQRAADRNVLNPTVLDPSTGFMAEYSPWPRQSETKTQSRRHGRSGATDGEVGSAFLRLTSEPGLEYPQTPNSNTGFETSAEHDRKDAHENRVLVDYLSVTFRGPYAMDRAMAFYGPTEDCWVEGDHGAMGFESVKRRGEVQCFYGGEKMKDLVHIQARGMGCRQLESEGYINGTGMLDGEMSHWQAHFADLIAAGAEFSQLHFAIDEFDGRLDIAKIIEYMRNKDISATFGRGKAKSPWFNINLGINNAGEDCGQTLQLGKSASNFHITIYHKGAEQFVKGKEDAILDWVRFEAKARNEKADKLAAAIVQYGVQAVVQVIWSALDFKDPDDKEDLESNTYRRKTVAWYSEWLDTTSKLRLQMGKHEKSVETLKTWLESQVAAALHVLVHATGCGWDYIESLVELGGQKLKARHISMLVADRLQKEGVNGNGDDRACSSRRSIGLQSV